MYILVINEGLWFGDKLKNSLINPNQLRYAGLSVQDNPFHASEPLAISHDDGTVPLTLDGTTIFFQTLTPTQAELDNSPLISNGIRTPYNRHLFGVRRRKIHSVTDLAVQHQVYCRSLQCSTVSEKWRKICANKGS